MKSAHFVLGVVPLEQTHSGFGHVQGLDGGGQVLEPLDVRSETLAKVLEKRGNENNDVESDDYENRR